MQSILNSLDKIMAELADIKTSLIQTKTELVEIKQELADIKKELVEVKTEQADATNARHFDNWIPRKMLMSFLQYGDTQIAAMFKKGGLTVSEIGNRRFIKKDSVIKLLEENIK